MIMAVCFRVYKCLAAAFVHALLSHAWGGHKQMKANLRWVELGNAKTKSPRFRRSLVLRKNEGRYCQADSAPSNIRPQIVPSVVIIQVSSTV